MGGRGPSFGEGPLPPKTPPDLPELPRKTPPLHERTFDSFLQWRGLAGKFLSFGREFRAECGYRTRLMEWVFCGKVLGDLGGKIGDFLQENFEKNAKAVDKNVFLVYNYMYLRECATRGRDFGQYGKGNGLRNERRFVENDWRGNAIFLQGAEAHCGICPEALR